MTDPAILQLAQALNVILTKGESPAETPAAEASATPASPLPAATPAIPPAEAPSPGAATPEIGVAVPGATQAVAPMPGQRLNGSADLDRLFSDAAARDAYFASPGGEAEIDRLIAEEAKGGRH